MINGQPSEFYPDTLGINIVDSAGFGTCRTAVCLGDCFVINDETIGTDISDCDQIAGCGIVETENPVLNNDGCSTISTR